MASSISLFDGPARRPESPLTQREMDLARSVQDITEEVMLRLSRTVQKETGAENLCLAGGVALNCVGNGRILREGPFKNIWIQPAAGDAGGAVGAAYSAWHQLEEQPRHTNGCKDKCVAAILDRLSATTISNNSSKTRGFPTSASTTRHFLPRVAEELASEKVVGWLQGPMEFGPRALGGRSILGDPRSSRMQSVMNLKIKYRESFRPFAPSVLREKVSEYFEMDVDSPYMLLVAPVETRRRLEMSSQEKALWGIDLLNVPRSDIPAVTHVDYSARVQTVHEDTNPRYYRLLQQFEMKTGCAVLVNTSFNVRGEPIVCSPQDAYRCFMRTEMDVLVLENCVLYKDKQKPLDNDTDWKKEFDLD